MAKSIKVHPKKRRGRPATGKDPLVSARLPKATIAAIEAWAAANSASRSEAIRRLVEFALEETKRRQEGVIVTPFVAGQRRDIPGQ